jgi:hypothetical protein
MFGCQRKKKRIGGQKATFIEGLAKLRNAGEFF